jgi:hypothetical protein
VPVPINGKKGAVEALIPHAGPVAMTWRAFSLPLSVLLAAGLAFGPGGAARAELPPVPPLLPGYDVESGESTEAPAALSSVVPDSPAPCCVHPPALPCPCACGKAPLPPWLDNISLLAGLDGSKEPEDLGVNAHFGFRLAANCGGPIWEQYGLGAQVGTALNYEYNAVRVLKGLNGPTDRTQTFTTLGVFQRSNLGINWGVVYDFRIEDYYLNFTFGQVRAQLGYQFDPSNEVGLWGTLRTTSTGATVSREDVNLRPIDQINFFWRHVWEGQQVTRMWVGLAEGHGRFLLVSPGESQVNHPITFGADVLLPLTDYLAVFGEAQFITPNDTGTVTAFFGIAFYPGGGARRAATSRFAPYLPLANNPSFAVDLRQ